MFFRHNVAYQKKRRNRDNPDSAFAIIVFMPDFYPNVNTPELRSNRFDKPV